ncbi:MAG TPA: phosphate ABC transporter ATP-binding protein, partial [Microbacterium sp.]|nr:phosphate ABC transporter ATP-binding protein [Microbacterium sp.]
MSAENAPSAAPLLDVQSVYVYYGEFHALQDVS